MRRISKGLLISSGVMSLGVIGWATTHVDAGAGAESAMFAVHQCSYCHTIHGGGGGPSLTINADVEVLCQSCHGAAGSSPLKAEVHKNKTKNSGYVPFYISCVGCHNPHDYMTNWLGGTNIRLVGTDVDGTGIARIATPNSGIREVVFESRGTGVGEPALHSFADDDLDNNDYWDGICETCHTEAGNHQNTSSGNHSHNVGKTCALSCHIHPNGFQRRSY